MCKNSNKCYIIHLCVVSLRHEKYRTQYRAMFVMNCTVKADEVLRYQTQSDRKQRNRKRRKVETTPDQAAGPTPAGMDADELYHPVCCSECSTEVAVFDKEEVYHFFNVLASHCWDTETCGELESTWSSERDWRRLSSDPQRSSQFSHTRQIFLILTFFNQSFWSCGSCSAEGDVTVHTDVIESPRRFLFLNVSFFSDFSSIYLNTQPFFFFGLRTVCYLFAVCNVQSQKEKFGQRSTWVWSVSVTKATKGFTVKSFLRFPPTSNKNKVNHKYIPPFRLSVQFYLLAQI